MNCQVFVKAYGSWLVSKHLRVLFFFLNRSLSRANPKFVLLWPWLYI